MRKEEQMLENEECLKAYKVVQPIEFKLLHCLWGTRLNKCRAWTYEVNDMVILRSYHSIIAVIKDGTCYDFLRFVYGYTSTSAQHICKFMKKYNVVSKFTYREIA